MVGGGGQGGRYIRLVFTTGAGNSIMGKMNPTTRKCTQAEAKQLEAFREKQPSPAGNPIQWNELGSVANWRLREENTFALLEENASGKTNPQTRSELALQLCLALEAFPANWVHIF